MAWKLRYGKRITRERGLLMYRGKHTAMPGSGIGAEQHARLQSTRPSMVYVELGPED